MTPLVRCPRCDADAALTCYTLPIQFVTPPPRQVEPFVRYTKWQCLVVEDHQGTFSEPTNEGRTP